MHDTPTDPKGQAAVKTGAAKIASFKTCGAINKCHMSLNNNPHVSVLETRTDIITLHLAVLFAMAMLRKVALRSAGALGVTSVGAAYV